MVENIVLGCGMKVALPKGCSVEPKAVKQQRPKGPMGAPLEKVVNVWSSTAGTGSDFFDLYRRHRYREMNRLEQMDRDWQETHEFEEFQKKREDRRKAAEELTGKRAEKRKRREANRERNKKLQAQAKEVNHFPNNGSFLDCLNLPAEAQMDGEPTLPSPCLLEEDNADNQGLHDLGNIGRSGNDEGTSPFDANANRAALARISTRHLSVSLSSSSASKLNSVNCSEDHSDPPHQQLYTLGNPADSQGTQQTLGEEFPQSNLTPRYSTPQMPIGVNEMKYRTNIIINDDGL